MVFDSAMIHRDASGIAYLSVRDNDGILDAAERGEEPALQAIRARLGESPSGASPLVRDDMIGLCDIAIARVHGDYDGADALLDRLARSLGVLGDPSQSVNPLDLMIDLTRSGDQLLRGKAGRWAETQERLERLYFAPLRAIYRMPDLTFRNMDLVRLVVPAASIPGQTVSASPSERVPFTRWMPIIGRKSLFRPPARW